MKTIHLEHGHSLTLDQLEAVAHGARLELSQGHRDDVARCRDFLEQLIDERRRIYGVTTGYGPLANTYVDTTASAELQRGLVYHLSSGTGPQLQKHQVRAIMASRVAALAQGHSAVKPATLQRLLDCLSVDFVPEIPSLGTVGASGDLTPLAHMTLALMGEGGVSLQGRSMPAAEALAELGWAAFDPQGKDALALVNGTSAMTGIAALNSGRAKRQLQLSVMLTALYGELLEGHREAFQPGLAQVRPHPGQSWAQQALLRVCATSQRLQPVQQPPPRLPERGAMGRTMLDQPLPQDAYTFRCSPQHLGAVWDTLAFHDQVVVRELNSVTDNPIFYPDSGEVLHGGNFFGQHVALVADALNNALLTLAIHSERRIARITDPIMNQGLPPFVRGNNNGLHSGFMGAQVTASALVAELRTHAHPASIQSIPTNANNQDVVTMGTIAARRCADTLDRLSELLAIETMILVQGYNLKGGQGAGFAAASQALAGRVRQEVAFLDNDRPLSADIYHLSRIIDDPEGMTELFQEFLPSWSDVKSGKS